MTGRRRARRPDHSLSGVRRRTIYAAIRVALEKKGTPIGAHDMLIAAHAHARATNAVCVTDNLAEFKRVPALKVENWVR